MNKFISLLLSISLLFTSCFPFKTLHSTTYIKANDAFILGNNEHGKFSAQVTNKSTNEITIWQYPLSGGKHSPVLLKGGASAKVKVNKNTSLRFENMTSNEVTIRLKVKGDLGLSMGYKN